MTSASVVAGASLVLAAASPDRPVHDGFDPGCRGEESAQKAADLVGGQADQPVLAACRSPNDLYPSRMLVGPDGTRVDAERPLHVADRVVFTMTWSRMRTRVPSSVQIRSRSCAIFQGPQRSDRSRHGTPVRSFTGLR